MRFSSYRAFLIAALLCLPLGLSGVSATGQAPAESSSSGMPQSSSSSSAATPEGASREKAPALVDPAGPTISLISSEPVFIMAAALNACGYDEGLQQSAPVRQRVRDEINQALAKSEAARSSRDKVCLFIAQHRMTGTEKDISQYISLALYLTPPPELETTRGTPRDAARFHPGGGDCARACAILPRRSTFTASG